MAVWLPNPQMYLVTSYNFNHHTGKTNMIKIYSCKPLEHQLTSEVGVSYIGWTNYWRYPWNIWGIYTIVSYQLHWGRHLVGTNLTKMLKVCSVFPPWPSQIDSAVFFRHMMKGPCGMRKNRFHVDMSRPFFCWILRWLCSQTQVILWAKSKHQFDHQ